MKNYEKEVCMPFYFLVKRAYVTLYRVPLIGGLLRRIGPSLKKLLKKGNAPPLSVKELSEELDLTLRALRALQKSVRTEMEENRTALKVELSDYRSRVEFVRLELFEQFRGGGRQAEKAVPAEILNREKYDEAARRGSFRLNIGCGHKPLPDYINVDIRSLPGVDIVAGAEELPFEPGVLAEIYSAHLLEHFTPPQLRTLLSYWRDALSPGGILRIVVPDAEAMILAWINEQMNFGDLCEVTFGAQDYDSDFHYTMFTPASLAGLLRVSGFGNVQVKAVNRMNGKCREMELTAVKDI